MNERAVSTVLDVALALLLVSASVLVLGLYLQDSDDGLEETDADRTAETLAATTISVQYDLSAVEEGDQFVPPEKTSANTYDRTEYGPATGLLADAAVTNARVDDDRLLTYGDEYEDAVDASIGSTLVGSNHHVYAVAVWEPYENATVRGEATAGQRSPPDEDVGSATLTVSSGMTDLEEETIREAYENGDDREEGIALVSELIAERIVDGYFDHEASQHALESQGIDRSLKVYHYQQTAAATNVEFDDPDDGESPLSRTGANATAANERLVYGDEDRNVFLEDFWEWLIGDDEANGLAALIAEDITEEALADEIDAIDEEYDGDAANERVGELLAESVSVGELTITIQTWDS
ncbi:DUF7284 family protein [Natronobacterium texcoconense]|uniref:DUF7284 family protein n=1 Tax=Natronobacterium texcoconense TaxID=1095778 RepID=UPI001FCDC6E8|nr:hypothetical protein [Natronobacterium texcoconense]